MSKYIHDRRHEVYYQKCRVGNTPGISVHWIAGANPGVEVAIDIDVEFGSDVARMLGYTVAVLMDVLVELTALPRELLRAKMLVGEELARMEPEDTNDATEG